MTTQIRLAPLGRRTTAMVIDSLVLSVFVLILFYDPLMQLSGDIAAAITPEAMQKVYDDMSIFNRQSLPYIFALYALYHGLLVWQSGMTVGKYIMKMKVVDSQSEGRLSFSKSMVRALARTAGELFLFYLTFLPAFFNPLRQTIHDKLAGSLVIDTRIDK